MKKALVALALAAIASSASALVSGSIHDLSTSGTGATYSVGSLSPCQYCHAPHWSNGAMTAAPLWNRDTPNTAGYTLYSGMLATPPVAVNDRSLACLTCHDGATPLGDLYGTAADTGAGGLNTIAIAAGRTNLTGDLSDDHPVSVAYPNTPGVFNDRATAEGFGIDFGGQAAGAETVECGTCHDPHVNDVAAGGNFLRTTPEEICIACHLK